jgi:Uma2 family endonuclease
MSPDEFLHWCLHQEGKWELVGGEPIQLMAGATKNHDRVVVNLIAELRGRLRGGPCFPTTDDVAARMAAGNIRRPDVTIDCARGGGNDLESTEPAVFFEVLSPSTQSYDFIVKAEEYKQVPSLRHFVLIDPRRPRVSVWSRGRDGFWTGEEVTDLQAELTLPGVGASLPLSEIYDGVELEP